MLIYVKRAAGGAAAIFLASIFGLQYSASAGIITLLTIQDTTKETIAISIKRFLAFLLATVLSYAIFSMAGYNALAYGIFLFLFMICCRPLQLSAAVSTNAVLVTHYMVEGTVSLSWIANEALLLCVGAGIGVLLNLYMPGKGKEIRTAQHTLEEDLRTVLLRMSEYMIKEDKSNYTGSCFDKLLADIDSGKKQAFAYVNNTFFQEAQYFIAYMAMREQQCAVLKDIYKKIVSMKTVWPQTKQIASFIYEISVSFGEANNAKALLETLSELYQKMRVSPLPDTREEFEERAILFAVLVDLEYFLQLKKEFSDALTEEQIRRYWQKRQ